MTKKLYIYYTFFFSSRKFLCKSTEEIKSFRSSLFFFKIKIIQNKVCRDSTKNCELKLVKTLFQCFLHILYIPTPTLLLLLINMRSVQ